MSHKEPVDPYNCEECQENVQKLARQLSRRPTLVKLGFHCYTHGEQEVSLEYLKELRITQLEDLLDLTLKDNQKLRGELAVHEHAVQG